MTALKAAPSIFRTVLLAALALIVAACSTSEPTLAPAEVMMDDTRMTTFRSGMETLEMDGVMAGEDELTIFAPTVQAFADYADELGITIIELLASPELEAILSYHIVPGIYNAADLSDGQSLATVAGPAIAVGVDANGVTLNGSASVTEADIAATNTVIHVIDKVLVAPQEDLPTIVDIAAADERFSTLVAAVQAAGLVDALSGEDQLTVFAPTNDAFAALLGELGIGAEELLASPDLKDILLYHVVAGKVTADQVVTLETATTLNGKDISIDVRDGKVFLNDTIEVIITDIMASNGVIHVLDGVLVPPADEPTPETIVDIAVNDTRFSTLVAALGAADLVDTLKGDGPFTVFAPTNDAFAALLADLGISAEALLASPDLKDILLYHVVSGEATAETVVNLDSVTTLNGKDVTIEVRDGKVFLNDTVEVIITDITASNGVIHVLDGVLIPPADEPAPKTIVDIAIEDGRFTTLVAALGAADLVGTLEGDGPFTVFAPTDDAFAALLADLHLTAEELLARSDLKDILLYHVAAGSISAETARGVHSFDTVQGASVSVSIDHDDNIVLNGAVKVIIEDIVAANGVIHVLDGVLLPPSH